MIDNDFMVRTDLRPWLCALYVEPAERGRRLGSDLLAHGRREAAELGYDTVYLNTDLIGYYEKYGWRYMGEYMHQDGEYARVYKADAISDNTKTVAPVLDGTGKSAGIGGFQKG